MKLKPPVIVYLLCIVSWVGLVLSSAQFASGRLSGVNGIVGLTVMVALALYFSFFAIKRFRYDRIKIGKPIELVDNREISAGHTLQLCRINANHAVKVQLELACKQYDADESFSVQITDGREDVVIEEIFVPAFGKFRLETEITKERLPIEVLVKNAAKVSRKIQSCVRYAEINQSGVR